MVNTETGYTGEDGKFHSWNNKETEQLCNFKTERKECRLTLSYPGNIMVCPGEENCILFRGK